MLKEKANGQIKVSIIYYIIFSFGEAWLLQRRDSSQPEMGKEDIASLEVQSIMFTIRISEIHTWG